MDQGKTLIRLALFGKPVKSSLSPVIHRMFAEKAGLEIDYRLIETDSDGFPTALEDFRISGGVGCNVTLPLKRDAWQLAVEATAEVRQAQAANTLVFQSSLGWFAHTTDGTGLVADISRNHKIALEGQRVLVLGAGGAAASVLGSLLAANPAQIVLINRNMDRAHALRARFASSSAISIASWKDLPSQGAFDLLINATSLGHHGEAPKLLPSLFAPGAVCYDLNYFKASLPLKKLCGELDQPYLDGLGMLVEQAAESFYIWTGVRPDSQSVVEACRDMVGR